MGMDVYGKNPTGETGKYFRQSVWGWRPLADMICTLWPIQAAGCTYWQTNDGDGLDAASAKSLAKAMLDDRALIRDYIAERDAYLARLPRETCHICTGTGIRTDAIGVEMKQPEKVVTYPSTHPRLGEVGWCNGCDGMGTNPDHRTHYRLSMESVDEFRAFLEACGGFEIN